MKDRSIVPIDREKVMRQDDFIVSKTDASGRLTYGNRIFIEFSGYSEEELLGEHHNIIRHPDMPRGAFKLVWETIKAEREFFGFVKNMARDGSFYWVFTHITPDYDARGSVAGYLSVRRKPNPKAVPIVESLYREMVEAERRAGPRQAVEASAQLLSGFLQKKGSSYEELVLALQG